MKKGMMRGITITTILLFALSNRPAIKIDAQSQSNPLLSEMTEEACMNFLTENGIEIPEYLIGTSQCGTLVKDTIQLIEEEPDYPVYMNNREGNRFVKSIQRAVNAYYGIDLNTYVRSSSLPQYVLQDSLVQDEEGNWVSTGGVWNPIWRQYNCYAYAIHRTEQPLFYDDTDNPTQYYIGDFIGIDTSGLEIMKDVSKLATYVKLDLEAIGCQHVELHTEIPSITDDQELICVRSGDYDYHFMRYDPETDAWYHKPGDNAIMKYKYTPSNDREWTAECSFEGRTMEGNRNLLYDNPIYYITYDKNRIQLNDSQSYDEIIRTVRPSKDTMIEVEAKVQKECHFELDSAKEFTVDLYDEGMNFIKNREGTSIRFSRMMNHEKIYLRMNFTDPNNTSGITLKAHYHTYTGHYCDFCSQYTETHQYGAPYQWVNTKQHRSSCSCGETRLEGHAVSLSAYQANASSAICLLCKGRADFGFIQAGIRGQSVMRTKNGSFVSSCGILFLADPDIASFLLGTLVFEEVSDFVIA